MNSPTSNKGTIQPDADDWHIDLGPVDNLLLIDVQSLNWPTYRPTPEAATGSDPRSQDERGKAIPAGYRPRRPPSA